MTNRITRIQRIIKSRYKNTKKWDVRKNHDSKRRRSHVRSNIKTKRVYTGGIKKNQVAPISDVDKSSSWDCKCRFAENSPEILDSNTKYITPQTVSTIPNVSTKAAVAAAVAAAAAIKSNETRPSPPKEHFTGTRRPRLKYSQSAVSSLLSPPQNQPQNQPQTETDILRQIYKTNNNNKIQGGGAPPEVITKNVICECKKRTVVRNDNV